MDRSGRSSFRFHPSSFPWRYPFCCTFPILGRQETASDGGRYPPPCPVEPGLSSPRPARRPKPPGHRAATVQPARGYSHSNRCARGSEGYRPFVAATREHPRLAGSRGQGTVRALVTRRTQTSTDFTDFTDLECLQSVESVDDCLLKPHLSQRQSNRSARSSRAA
jgi:hypothetical protein